MMMYDTVVIGAGVAGCSVAYELQKQGQKVLVVDKQGIASGGSGAAGAFVSPKVGKGSSLQKLTNEAFSYSKDFYLKYIPQFFNKTGVLRIPKDGQDAKKFYEYEEFHTNVYEWYGKERLKELGIDNSFESVFFPEAGDVDAKSVCGFLLDGIDFKVLHIDNIEHKNDVWVVGEYTAKNVVIATGYEQSLIDVRYMGIKGTWGTRGDFETSLDLQISMHKDLSVGANVNGVLKLGATHEKSVKTKEECKENHALSLEKKASTLVNTTDFKLLKTYCGMRSGSKDYVPLVGKVIDVEYMLNRYPNITRGAKPELKHKPNLFVCNGLGGRGFVFGPFVGKLLAEHIVAGVNVDSRVNPDRLFLKWCRKLKV